MAIAHNPVTVVAAALATVGTHLTHVKAKVAKNVRGALVEHGGTTYTVEYSPATNCTWLTILGVPLELVDLPHWRISSGVGVNRRPWIGSGKPHLLFALPDGSFRFLVGDEADLTAADALTLVAATGITLHALFLYSDFLQGKSQAEGLLLLRQAMAEELNAGIQDTGLSAAIDLVSHDGYNSYAALIDGEWELPGLGNTLDQMSRYADSVTHRLAVQQLPAALGNENLDKLLRLALMR